LRVEKQVKLLQLKTINNNQDANKKG
jgi:hypothetical protein